MKALDRICAAADCIFSALYKPMVIALLCAISYQVGNLQ